MENKILMGVIGLTVAVITVAVVLMPVINDSMKTNDTFINEGYFRVQEYSGDSIEYSAFWDHTNPKQITVNGSVLSLENITHEISLILDGDFFLRYYPNYLSTRLYYGTTPVLDATQDNGFDMTVSYSEGVLTVSNSDSLREITIDKFYSISTTGNYTMKKSNESAYMKSDSLIYGCGRTTASHGNIGTLISGTISDIDVTIWRGDYTATNLQINKTAVNDHKDLYKFDNVKFTAVPTGEGNSETITYSYVVIPYQVTAERAIHFDDSTNAIIAAIPVIVIVAILLMAVALIVRNKE